MSVEICTHPWKYAVEPFRILDGLYYVGNGNVSSYLTDTGDGLILFDTAFPQTVYLLLESIRRLGFDPDDIAYLVHSHGHYDHMGGTKAVKELTGAKTLMGRADASMGSDNAFISPGDWPGFLTAMEAQAGSQFDCKETSHIVLDSQP